MKFIRITNEASVAKFKTKYTISYLRSFLCIFHSEFMQLHCCKQTAKMHFFGENALCCAPDVSLSLLLWPPRLPPSWGEWRDQSPPVPRTTLLVCFLHSYFLLALIQQFSTTRYKWALHACYYRRIGLRKMCPRP